MTRMTAFIRYSFSPLSGSRKAAKSAVRSGCSSGCSSATAYRGLPASCTPYYRVTYDAERAVWALLATWMCGKGKQLPGTAVPKQRRKGWYQGSAN